MSAGIDTAKSLAELSGIDWGPAPESAGTMVRERHEIRRKQISVLTADEIIRFLDMPSDVSILVPIALERLLQNPEQVGLLCAVLRADGFDWKTRPDMVRAVRTAVDNCLGELHQDEGLQSIQYQLGIWRWYALFERNLSVIV